MIINIQCAWIGFLLGCIAGAIPGMFFHRGDWLGGYSSWRRRMLRLAHISFFGIGFINLLFSLTSRSLNIEKGLGVASVLLVLGAVSMPLVCYLSAWKTVFRNLFFIPAGTVTVAVMIFTWRVITL